MMLVNCLYTELGIEIMRLKEFTTGRNIFDQLSLDVESTILTKHSKNVLSFLDSDCVA